MDKLTHKEKVELLRAVGEAQNVKEREAYIKSRAEKIQEHVKRKSFAREIFKEVELEPGAEPAFELDAELEEDTTYVSNSYGTPIKTQVTGGNRFYIPCDWIEDYRDFTMEDARNGRLDVAEKAELELANAFIRKEDTAAFALMKSAIPSSNVVDISSTSFDFDLLNELMIVFDQIREKYPDLQMRVLYLSPRSAGDLRAWAKANLGDATKEDMKAVGVDTDTFRIPGFNILFHKVPYSSFIADNEVYLVDNERLGRFVVRESMETQEDPTAAAEWKIGIMAREKVGLGVTNPYAVVKGIITRS